MSTRSFFIGLDGGGTGCRARLVDDAGTVLGQGAAGPATLRLGATAVWQSMTEAIAASSAGNSLPDAAEIHVGAGLAGLSRKQELAALRTLPHRFASLTIVSDGLAACIGAHGGGDGGIVIAGTGSVAVAWIGGREHQVGGHGFPVSDAGSGADVGLEALRYALRAHDRLEAATPLSRAVMARFDEDAAKATAWMDRATATDYAALAPLVVRCAGEADDAAQAILQNAAHAVAGLIRAVCDRGAPRVALLGGFASAVEPWLPVDARRCLSPPAGDGIDGALHLARRAAQASPAKPQ